MNDGHQRLFLGLGVALILTTGCPGPTANIYDVCSGTEQCPGTTVCLVANATTGNFQGSFCSYACNVDTDCPLDGFASPVCIANQCYAGCPGNTGCPYAEVCATDGNVLFCVP